MLDIDYFVTQLCIGRGYFSLDWKLPETSHLEKKVFGRSSNTQKSFLNLSFYYDFQKKVVQKGKLVFWQVYFDLIPFLLLFLFLVVRRAKFFWICRTWARNYNENIYYEKANMLFFFFPSLVDIFWSIEPYFLCLTAREQHSQNT